MTQTILILDDEPDNLQLMKQTLHRHLPQVRVVTYLDPQQALNWCMVNSPDLCLVDYRMPGMSGIEFIRAVRQSPRYQSVPILMITGQPVPELQQEALDSGATDFLCKPINVADVLARTRNHLRIRENMRAGRDDVGDWGQSFLAAQRLVEQEQSAIIQRLTSLSGYRDEETGNHMRRMAHISRLVAEEIGLDQKFCDMLVLAAPMHDIGKIGIPDRILLKQGNLTGIERGIMQTHAKIGYDLLKGSSSEVLLLGAEIALSHHEKYNGQGYPDGVSGDAIPISGRICAVADVFDALANVRHYKQAWALEDVVELMRKERGRHLDPNCVTSLLRRLDDVMDIQRQFADPISSGSGSMPEPGLRRAAHF